MTDQSMGVSVRERRALFEGSYRILDHRVRIRSEVPEVGALVGRYLEGFAARSPAPGETEYVVMPLDGELVIARNGERLPEAAGSAAGVLDVLLWRVHTDAMERVERFVSIHASAAAWQGQGLILPAPMDSGKSTTIAGLVRAGFDYLTDEAALIDLETGWLHPYHKPLTFDPPTLEVIPELQSALPPELEWGSRLRYHVPAEDIRPGSLGDACPVRFVIAPRYAKGGPTELIPMSPSQAVVMLAENSFNFVSLGPEGLAALGKACEGAEGFLLRIGDLESAVAAVRGLVESSDPASRT